MIVAWTGMNPVLVLSEAVLVLVLVLGARHSRSCSPWEKGGAETSGRE